MNSEDERDIQKVIYLYSERDDSSMIILSTIEHISEQLKFKPLIFGIVDLDKNEIPALQDIDLPSLVSLKGYGDNHASNYEGNWTSEDMKTFILSTIEGEYDRSNDITVESKREYDEDDL